MKLNKRQTEAKVKPQTSIRMKVIAIGVETVTISVLGIPSIGT